MEREVGAIGCRSLRPIVLIRRMTFSDLQHETITSESVLRRARSRKRETNGNNVSNAQNCYKVLFFLLTTLDICLGLVSTQVVETKVIFIEELVVNCCQQ